MTDIYVRSSDGNNADSGLTWALAKATIPGAFTIAGAGDRIFVADDHTETFTVATAYQPASSSPSNPVLLLCVNDTGNPEPPTALATTAVVNTTGAGSLLFFAGNVYCQGITFNAGAGANDAGIYISGSAYWFWHFHNCLLALTDTNAASIMQFGNNDISTNNGYVILENTPLSFGAASQNMFVFGCSLLWKDTPAALPTLFPSPLFTIYNGVVALGATILVEGVDLSAASTGKSLVQFTHFVTGSARLRNCKLGASVALPSGTPDAPSEFFIEALNCDSADTNYRHERYTYYGSQVVSTSVVRTGGASNATTPLSWLIVAARVRKFLGSFQTFPLTGFLHSTGSKTFTVSYIHTASVGLQDDEIWIDLEYLGSGSFPISSHSRDRKATVLATATNQTADTASVWDSAATARANTTVYALSDIRRAAAANGRLFVVTTAGTSAGSEPAAFATAADGDAVTDNTVTWRCMRREKLSVTVTVAELGAYTAVVRVATTTTVFVDPFVQEHTVPGRQWISPGGEYLQGTGGQGPLLGPGRLARNS